MTYGVSKTEKLVRSLEDERKPFSGITEANKITEIEYRDINRFSTEPT